MAYRVEIKGTIKQNIKVMGIRDIHYLVTTIRCMDNSSKANTAAADMAMQSNKHAELRLT